MRTCAAKVQLPSECRISHSSQSTYFDAVALVGLLTFQRDEFLFLQMCLDFLQRGPTLKIADPNGLQVLKCRVSVRRHFCHPSSFQGRGCENGRSTEDPASES